MTAKVFSVEYLDDVVLQATIAPRLRQHRNIHTDYAESCQRLFNAIEPDSYIRPHRHGLVPRYETMIAVRGLMMLFVFDDHGRVADIAPFEVDSVIRCV
jgi:cupin fold WbuC family metalloprotein